MAKTILTEYQRVQNTQNTALDLRDYTAIVSAKVRWRGAQRVTTIEAASTNTGPGSAAYPNPPAGFTFTKHRFIGSGIVFNTDSVPITVWPYYDAGNGFQTGNPVVVQPGGNTVISADVEVHTNKVGYTTVFSWQASGASSGSFFTVSASTDGIQVTVSLTQNPKTIILGQQTQHSGTLADAEESQWYDVLGLQAGAQNSVRHESSGSNQSDVRFEITAEPKLPAPQRHAPSDQAEDRRPWFEITLTADADNSAPKYHARVRISPFAIMSPVTVAMESKEGTGEWEYFNGSIWLPFPAGGVNPGTRVRVRPESDLDFQIYYWDAAAYDGFGYGHNTPATKLRILIAAVGLYYLAIEGVEYLATSIIVSETSNGEVGSISVLLANDDGATNAAIKYGDTFVLSINDELGNSDAFQGLVRQKQPIGKNLYIIANTGDGILGERLVKQDYTAQDIGLTVKHIIENYCLPLSANNVDTATGFVATVAAKDKTPIRVLEELRRQYGIYYFVDQDWDMHFYKASVIGGALTIVQYGEV